MSAADNDTVPLYLEQPNGAVRIIHSTMHLIVDEDDDTGTRSLFLLYLQGASLTMLFCEFSFIPSLRF